MCIMHINLKNLVIHIKQISNAYVECNIIDNKTSNNIGSLLIPLYLDLELKSGDNFSNIIDIHDLYGRLNDKCYEETSDEIYIQMEFLKDINISCDIYIYKKYLNNICI